MVSRIQKCIMINRENLDVIEEGIESINLRFSDISLNNFLETRLRVKEIRKVIDQVEEVKVCWG